MSEKKKVTIVAPNAITVALLVAIALPLGYASWRLERWVDVRVKHVRHVDTRLAHIEQKLVSLEKRIERLLQENGLQEAVEDTAGEQ